MGDGEGRDANLSNPPLHNEEIRVVNVELYALEE